MIAAHGECAVHKMMLSLQDLDREATTTSFQEVLSGCLGVPCNILFPRFAGLPLKSVSFLKQTILPPLQPDKKPTGGNPGGRSKQCCLLNTFAQLGEAGLQGQIVTAEVFGL